MAHTNKPWLEPLSSRCHCPFKAASLLTICLTFAHGVDLVQLKFLGGNQKPERR